MKRRLIALALVATLALVGCADRTATSEPPPPEPSTSEPTPPSTEQPSSATSELAWLDIELTDAVTGEKFALADFKGKPVLLHPFATW